MRELSPAQLRAARGLIGWSQDELAKQAKVGRPTIADFESGKRAPYLRTLLDLKLALEGAGVIFVEENGEGPGVRLKKARPGDAGAKATSDTPKGDPYDGSAV